MKKVEKNGVGQSENEPTPNWKRKVINFVITMLKHVVAILIAHLITQSCNYI